MSRRTIILGDLHLVRHTPRGVVGDLVALLAEHPGARVVVAGDLFDLSSDAPGTSRREALGAALGAHPGLRAALGQHVDGGGSLWLVAGNHDAELGDPTFVAELQRELGLGGAARERVRVTPWFFRDGALHVEHGHLYDPDNAPAHPLVLGAPSLGVHFVERFIAPTGAHRYLHANDGTPLWLLLSAFRWYGWRGPHVVYRYFDAAFSALARSGTFYRGDGEVLRGRERVQAFAREAGVELDVVRALDDVRATPTLSSAARTATRLYLDRVVATVALGGGLAAAAGGAAGTAGVLAGFGALLLGASWAAGHDRYGDGAARAGSARVNGVQGHLAAGARGVREVTGARLVVLGHTHRESIDEGYANTGSFAFPRGAPGRPYLMIEGEVDAPRVVRRYAGGSEPG